MKKTVLTLFVIFILATLFVSACSSQIKDTVMDQPLDFEEEKNIILLAENEAIEENKQIAEQKRLEQIKAQEQLPAQIEQREENKIIKQLLEKINDRVESYSYFEGKNKVLVTEDVAKIVLYTDIRYDKKFIDAVYIDRKTGGAIAVCEDIKDHLDCRRNPDTKISILSKIFITKISDQWLTDALYYKIVEHNEFAETINYRPCSKLIMEDENKEQITIWYDQYWKMPIKIQKGDQTIIYKGYSYNKVDGKQMVFDFEN
ncbi:hypothetical protein KY340_04945 [Candidatus Woesearchaeota archaeon]|nr:hypothetical protein [Candidatus Woesearchaeota archaeon]